MRQSNYGWLLTACVFSLSGCAARNVTPVAMTQAGDDQLSCPALAGQIKANAAAAADFLQKDKQVETANVAKGIVGGLLAPIGLLIAATSDMSNEDQVKARSIIDRNERLTYLIKSKGCSEQ